MIQRQVKQNTCFLGIHNLMRRTDTQINSKSSKIENCFKMCFHTVSLIGSHRESLILAHPCEYVTHLIPCSVVGLQLNDIPCRKLLMLTMNYISGFPHSHLHFLLSNFTEFLVLWEKVSRSIQLDFCFIFYFFYPILANILFSLSFSNEIFLTFASLLTGI